ncbi:methyltransferase domain-containing protein [Streptacidiphilus sp. MAP5-52]|uniref:GFA family protein n=1 Tax=Streptacidiphilus sp. MAP5-52 TaxID=3156267 RepID=UPI003514188C
MTTTTSRLDHWNGAYEDGNPFTPLRTSERLLLDRHLPAPGGGTALDIGSGHGELTRHLAARGWATTGVDLAHMAVEHARGAAAEEGLQIRYLGLDIERDGFDAFPRSAFDLITCRLVVAFLDRPRFIALARHLLRPGGAVVVITPTTDRTPVERHGIALDETQIAELASGFGSVERHQADDLAVLELREALPSHPAQEKRIPAANALFGVGVVVHDPLTNRVLLGRSVRFPGLLEAIGGKPLLGERLADTVAREIQEEAGLDVDAQDVRLLAMTVDDRGGLPRSTVAAYVNTFSGTPEAREPHLIERWDWHPVGGALPGPLFQPSLDVLAVCFPHAYQSGSAAHVYPLAPLAALMQTARQDRTAYPPAGPAVREGGCQCGRLRYRATGSPDWPHACACRHCRLLSGATEMTWVSFDLAEFTWTGPAGEPVWHATWPTSRRGRCPDCGSQVCAHDEGATSIAVTLASLDDPGELVPVHQSFRDDALLWRTPIPTTTLPQLPPPAP